MSLGLIKNNLKLMLRSKWILIAMTFSPILLSLLLSTVFESMMDMDFYPEPFTVGFRMSENCKYTDTTSLLTAVFKENKITLLEFPNGNIEDLITNGTVSIFAEISDDALILYKAKDTEGEASIAESIFSSVFYKVNETNTLFTYQKEKGLTGSINAPEFTEASILSVRWPEVDPIPSSRDYYGIIEIVFFLWMGCVSLAAVIPSERKNHIEERMHVTCVTRLQLYLGKFIPCLLATGIEITIAIIISVFCLNVHWGNWGGTITILTLQSLAATALGIILFNISRSIAVSLSAGWVLGFVNGFLGGSFQTYIYSTIPDSLAKMAPQYYINRTLVEFSTKESSEYAIPCILILAAIFIISVAIGLLLIDRKAGLRA